MKRSEAVNIIEDVLKSGYDYPALTILRKLEDAGMLPPPSVTDVVSGYLLYCYYPHVEEKKEDDGYVLDRENSVLWEAE